MTSAAMGGVMPPIRWDGPSTKVASLNTGIQVPGGGSATVKECR